MIYESITQTEDDVRVILLFVVIAGAVHFLEGLDRKTDLIEQ